MVNEKNLDLTNDDNVMLRAFCYMMCMRTAEALNYTSLLTLTTEFEGTFDFLGENIENGTKQYNRIVIDTTKTYSSDTSAYPPGTRTIVDDPNSIDIIDELRSASPEDPANENPVIEQLAHAMMNIVGLEDDRPDRLSVNLVKMFLLDDERTVITQNHIATFRPDWRSFDEAFDEYLREKVSSS